MQASSTRKTKDSKGRRLGTKKLGGNEVFPMDILVRQRGFKWHPGENTYVGRDHTIHAKCEGIVKFEKDPWRQRKKIYVSVVPQELPSRRKFKTTPPPPYCYHPELFPELAKNNPEPTNLKVPQRVAKPAKARVVGVKDNQTHYSKQVFVPQNFTNVEERETLSEGEQYVAYLEQIDNVYNPQEVPELESIQEEEEQQ